MKLYDEVIKNWSSLEKDCSLVKYNADLGTDWPDVGNHQMILRSDMAYELGGSNPSFYAMSATAVTSDNELVSQDEIVIIGTDLKDIKGDTSYARLMVVLTDADALGDGNALYDAVKKIENVRFHVNPEGFMMRVSSVYARESIRISKSAIDKGLSLKHAGSLMIKELHKNPVVKAAKIVYITDKDFDYKKLETSVKQANSITSAIDHIMKNAMTDCNTCGLKPVCDEVEGLREMHFGENANTMRNNQ